MPQREWLKGEFNYGYHSGNILSFLPDSRRFGEQRKIGGSYRRVFVKAIKPYINARSTVMELGPGAGDWTRAILQYVTEGRVVTLDYQDVAKWLNPANYGGRLTCIQVSDNSFSAIEDSSVDFFWSMGVLCHNNTGDIQDVLSNALSKMRPGGMACHQHGDWEKLNRFGWQRGGVPERFQKMPDDEIWWPRNTTKRMSEIASQAGWEVVSPDLGLLKRDGLILLRRPVA
jgi:SAM-dependent methyltransferase